MVMYTPRLYFWMKIKKRLYKQPLLKLYLSVYYVVSIQKAAFFIPFGIISL